MGARKNHQEEMRAMTKNQIRASKEGKSQEEARKEFARIVAERLTQHKHGCGM